MAGILAHAADAFDQVLGPRDGNGLGLAGQIKMDQRAQHFRHLRIAWRGIQRGRLGQALAILDHAFDMEGERFLGIQQGLIERGAHGDATGKIREGNAEAGFGMLDNGRVIAGRLGAFSFAGRC